MSDERFRSHIAASLIDLVLKLEQELKKARAEIKRLSIVDKTDHRFQPYHNLLEAECAKSAKLIEALKVYVEEPNYAVALAAIAEYEKS